MKGRWIMALGLLLAVSPAEELTTERHDIPYQGEKELDVGVEFGLGKLELKSNGDAKYIMLSEITYPNELYKPTVDYKTVGTRGKLRIASNKLDKDSRLWGAHKKDNPDIKNNHWQLAFIETIPTSYNIELGLGKGQLDFSRLQVSELNLECGLSDVVLGFDSNNKETIRNMVVQTGLGNVEAYGLSYANMERLNVECGLGSTTLRFDGELKQDIKGRVTVGLGSVNIKIPKEYGVQIEAERSFLSSLNFEGFREIDEDVYRSKNWNSAKRYIYLTVEIGLGSVDIEWIN
jgi:hypothetical protein